jgi:hypothetical protein
MPRNLFTSVLLFLGLGAGPAPARDLQVEVEVLHIGGLLAPAEIETLLADERLSIVATYEPTRLIEVQYSAYDTECAGEDSRSSRSVEAGWVEDGSLARYQVGSPSGTRTWLAVPAALAAQCDLQATPPASAEVQALTAELQRIRAAFLRP